MHIADDETRTEGKLDPVKARRRAQLLDAEVRNTMPQLVRGVTRRTREFQSRRCRMPTRSGACLQRGMNSGSRLVRLLLRSNGLVL